MATPPSIDEPAQHDARIPPELHELEDEVMAEVWSHDEVSVRQVMEALNRGRRKKRAYTTYMTIMSRLDSKGMLVRRRDGKTDYYRAAYTRADYADLRSGAAVDALVGRFGDVALAHMARQMAQLDSKHRRSLQRLGRRD